ncbi:MAG TPA: four-carbon acid sugar kinase family protein [Candidatus Limnocylindria bacterium]|nr:four-carbon acid sugar kinase family protein [Candidatus Limnocylindria bacterium]
MSDLRLTFCGDDFTGSTDVLEALATAGIRTVLFLEAPRPADLVRFDGVRAAGIASTSRAMTPTEMDAALGPAFESLRGLGAPLCHYKICSTFDSSPAVGSIGRAIDLGARVFGSRVVPLVVGAPVLRRYCAFGNLFATLGGETYRIDRHPVMSRHPVTPMDEGDVRLHLAKQTTRRIGLMNLLDLAGSRDDVDRRHRAILDGKPEVLLFDVLDDDRLAEVGRLIWDSGEPFAVGSSGIEYALAAAWRRSGLLPAAKPPTAPGPADRLLVVSGSCSAVTQGQIEWAQENGFEGIRVAPDGDEAELIRRARAAFDRGQNPVLYTALGPSDTAIQDARSRGARVGERLGLLAKRILEEERLTRLLVAGGDTSGYVARQLGLYALEMVAPIAPGSPLCRSRARSDAFDGLEIAMKGGQVGKPDYFASVLQGAA